MADFVKISVLLFVGAAWTAALFSMPAVVEGYDGESLSRWAAATAWRLMGTEIVRPVASQCGDQGASGMSVYQAKWETNCNLVVYKDFSPSWSSETQKFGFTVCYLAMQNDGNLVIYGERGDQRAVLWSSNTTQNYQDDFYVALTMYGQLGIFTSNHKNIWYTADVQSYGAPLWP